MVIAAYFDTSAAMKLVIEEPESQALRARLRDTPYILISSWLLHAELHCAAGRNPATIAIASISSILESVNLAELTRGDVLAAGTQAPLRSNDAIHLATALRLGVDEMLTYDDELAGAAAGAGITIIRPS